MTTETYPRHGSWKCGKGRAFTTFPQALLFLFENKNPNKITTKGREGGASAPHPLVEALFKRLIRNFLTLPFTYLGGSDDDNGYGIAVDESGNAYVTGYTESNNFPTTTGTYDTSFNGVYDVFVTKINPDGTSLVYSTYLGGSSSDHGRGIVIDGHGNACVIGYTASDDFPTTAGVFDTTYNGSNDAFAVKINPEISLPIILVPIGSALNKKSGTFNWLPGPGFLGIYRLVFIEKDKNGEIKKKFVSIKIEPLFFVKK